MDEGKLDILLKNLNENTRGRVKHYLKKVMDTRAFKLFRLHIVAFIDSIVSDDSFEHPPCENLV